MSDFLRLYNSGVGYLYLVDERTGMPCVAPPNPAVGDNDNENDEEYDGNRDGGEREREQSSPLSSPYPVRVTNAPSAVRELLPLMQMGMTLMRGDGAVRVLSEVICDGSTSSSAVAATTSDDEVTLDDVASSSPSVRRLWVAAARDILGSSSSPRSAGGEGTGSTGNIGDGDKEDCDDSGNGGEEELDAALNRTLRDHLRVFTSGRLPEGGAGEGSSAPSDNEDGEDEGDRPTLKEWEGELSFLRSLLHTSDPRGTYAGLRPTVVGGRGGGSLTLWMTPPMEGDRGISEEEYSCRHSHDNYNSVDEGNSSMLATSITFNNKGQGMEGGHSISTASEMTACTASEVSSVVSSLDGNRTPTHEDIRHAAAAHRARSPRETGGGGIPDVVHALSAVREDDGSSRGGEERSVSEQSSPTAEMYDGDCDRNGPLELTAVGGGGPRSLPPLRLGDGLVGRSDCAADERGERDVEPLEAATHSPRGDALSLGTRWSESSSLLPHRRIDIAGVRDHILADARGEGYSPMHGNVVSREELLALVFDSERREHELREKKDEIRRLKMAMREYDKEEGEITMEKDDIIRYLSAQLEEKCGVEERVRGDEDTKRDLGGMVSIVQAEQCHEGEGDDKEAGDENDGLDLMLELSNSRDDTMNGEVRVGLMMRLYSLEQKLLEKEMELEEVKLSMHARELDMVREKDEEIRRLRRRLREKEYETASGGQQSLDTFLTAQTSERVVI